MSTARIRLITAYSAAVLMATFATAASAAQVQIDVMGTGYPDQGAAP